MATKTDKDQVPDTKIEEKKQIIFDDTVNFSAGPCKEIKENWNQITLSLATNGGFTLTQGRNFILNVFINENINGKQVSTVKLFLVTKQELSDLIYESREFSAEVENYIKAREEENKKPISKDNLDVKKKDDKKKTTSKMQDIWKNTNKKKDVKPPAEEVDYDFNKDTIIVGDLEVNDE